MKQLAITLGALTLLGCGPKLKFTGLGAARPPKPPTCDFDVLTATPSEPHEQLGTIDIQYDNTGYLYEADDLKRKIRPHVCKAGGDAVVAYANSYGTYLKATVLALNPDKPSAEEASGSPAASGSEQPAPAASGSEQPAPTASAAAPDAGAIKAPKQATGVTPKEGGKK